VSLVAEKIEPKALTVKDACRALSVSRSHLYNLTDGGQLRRVKLGNRVLIPASEVDRVLAPGASGIAEARRAFFSRRTEP
jgi:excisionase family DNA binding protein